MKEIVNSLLEAANTCATAQDIANEDVFENCDEKTNNESFEIDESKLSNETIILFEGVGILDGDPEICAKYKDDAEGAIEVVTECLAILEERREQDAMNEATIVETAYLIAQGDPDTLDLYDESEQLVICNSAKDILDEYTMSMHYPERTYYTDPMHRSNKDYKDARPVAQPKRDDYDIYKRNMITELDQEAPYTRSKGDKAFARNVDKMSIAENKRTNKEIDSLRKDWNKDRKSTAAMINKKQHAQEQARYEQDFSGSEADERKHVNSMTPERARYEAFAAGYVNEKDPKKARELRDKAMEAIGARGARSAAPRQPKPTTEQERMADHEAGHYFVTNKTTGNPREKVSPEDERQLDLYAMQHKSSRR